MSKLNKLVPDIKLCKLIPKGEFEDSALVWVVNGDYQPKFAVVDRREYPFIPEDGATLYPAPTLEEIMDKLCGRINCNLTDCTKGARGWIIDCSVGIDDFAAHDENSGAAAALKLWLELKGIKYGK